MKKLITAIIVMMMVTMISGFAFANSPECLVYTYEWWEEANKEKLNMFHETVYFENGFEKYNTAWFAADMYIDSDFKSVKEIEKEIEENFIEEHDFVGDVKVNIIGEDLENNRYVIEIDVVADTDLRYVKNAGSMAEFEEPVYGLYIIAWMNN